MVSKLQQIIIEEHAKSLASFLADPMAELASLTSDIDHLRETKQQLERELQELRKKVREERKDQTLAQERWFREFLTGVEHRIRKSTSDSVAVAISDEMAAEMAAVESRERALLAGEENFHTKIMEERARNRAEWKALAQRAEEAFRQRRKDAEWSEMPSGIIYRLIDNGEVVYIGESNGKFARISNHGDKTFDSVQWIPAPSEKSHRLSVESDFIRDYSSQHGQRPRYNRADH